MLTRTGAWFGSADTPRRDRTRASTSLPWAPNSDESARLVDAPAATSTNASWWQGARLRLGIGGRRRPVDELISSVRRVLLVFAHMDDEINAAGLVARLVARGASVDVMVLTDGAANLWTDEAVVAGRTHFECRRSELEAVMKVLALHEAVLPAFPDSKLAEHLPSAIDAVSAELERRAPELVITFDSKGINGHPDHVAAHRATKEALIRTQAPCALAMLLPPPPFCWALGAGFRSTFVPTIATLELSDAEHELKARVFDTYRSQRRTLKLLTAGLPPRPFFALFSSEWFLWLSPPEVREWVVAS